MNIILSLDGVLSSDTGEPIRSGVALYYALNNGNRVALITSRTKADAEQWLFSHGIIGYDDLVTESVHIEGDELKKRQFKLSRSQTPVELYVDSDPAMCAWVFEQQRVTTLLFSHPSYAKVEARPDAPKPYRTWAEIEEAVNRANIARSVDRQRPNVEIGEYSD